MHTWQEGMMSLCKKDVIITSDMKRTQISLTPEQRDALRKLSSSTGRSMSDLIREAVDRFIEVEADPRKRALALLGAFEDDRGDVSARHDEVLSESMEP